MAGIGDGDAVLARRRDNRRDSSPHDARPPTFASGVVPAPPLHLTPADRLVETGTKNGRVKKVEDLRDARA